MGDFTAEELSILGEEPPEETVEQPPADDQGGAAAEAEKEPVEGEPKGDEPPAGDEPAGEAEDEQPVPQARFNEVYGQAKEAQRKLDLFKRLGPDEYYKIYPDEAPKPAANAAKPDRTATVGQPAADRVLSFSEAQNMIIDGGRYDGQRLGDVYKEDPIAASDIYLNYRDEQKTAIESAKATEASRKQEIETELNQFSGSIAKQMFAKEPSALTESEAKKVDDVVVTVLDWMEQTGRYRYKLEDAFMIMSKDDLLAAAKSEGAKAIINQLKGGSTPSVKSNKGSGGRKSGFEAYESMSRDQMATRIADMSDAEFQSFSNKAPQSLKDKFSDIAWT